MTFLPSLFSAAVLCLPLMGIPLVVHAQNNADQAGTVVSGDVGLASYRYREPGVMRLTGTKGVAQLRAAFDATGAVRVLTELRYVGGDVDYRIDARLGGGGRNDRRDYLVDARALLSYAMQLGGRRLTPYAGLGYRYLYNDLRRDMGSAGMRRDNRLLYLPVGATLVLQADAASSLSLRAEIDPMLAGRQRSRVSDSDPALSDVTNAQHHGIGARLALAYGRGQWRVTPYVDYWRIGSSDADPLVRNGAPLLQNGRTVLLSEPRNQTLEAGILIGYRF